MKEPEKNTMENNQQPIDGNLEPHMPGTPEGPPVIDETNTDKATEESKPVDEKELLAQKLGEMQDKFVRLYAEFDNFKKRTATERMDLIKTAGKEVIVSLLPVLDDFDRALGVMKKMEREDAVTEGVELVHSKLKKTLEQRGLKEMDCLKADFDSDMHEAITNIQTTPDMKGKVVDIMEKGYLLHDKVIRFAKVIVGA